MQHMLRRTIQLGDWLPPSPRLRRVPVPLLLLLLLFPLWPAGDADAQFAGALRGDYDVSVTRGCNIDGTVTENPPGTFFFSGGGTPPLVTRGVATFDGAGNVGFTGQLVVTQSGWSTTSPAGISTGTGTEIRVIQQDFTSCTGTYTVNADGTFSETMNCNLTFTTGPNAGLSATLDGISIRGKLAQDGALLVIGSTSVTAGDIERFHCPTCNGGVGITQRRICSATGTATARR